MSLGRVIFAVILLGTALVRAEARELALQPGEMLNYRVAWGIFRHAGEIKISARKEINDSIPHTVVNTRTSTRGTLRRLFRFEAEAEAVFDQRTGQLMVYTESSSGKKKKTNFALEFDYGRAVARYTDFVNSGNNREVVIPGESPMDLIMSLVQTRMWDLQPKQKRDIDVIFGKDIYQLTVHALRYEKVETPLGEFNTVVLEPRMEKTPPKGMFRRGSQVHVWISRDDERHLPVMFEVEFSFGAGVAMLAEYLPPGSEPAQVAAE